MEPRRPTRAGLDSYERIIEAAFPTGLPPHVHAIGDKGNRIILDIFDTNLVDPGRTNPAALLKARVRFTIAGGRIVYTARPE